MLADGSAGGLRTAEIGISTCKAVMAPRDLLSEIAKRPESQKKGVYILVGSDTDKPGQLAIYVGETDVILGRLKTHDAKLEFWNEVVFLVPRRRCHRRAGTPPRT